MLNDFIKGVLKSDRASKIVSSIKDLISVARMKDIPIFYCNDEHIEDDPELKIWGSHSMKGTEGSQIIPELKPDHHDRYFTEGSIWREGSNYVDNNRNSYPYLYKTYLIWGVH
jgi:nicotinamidase-related amidase